MFSSQTVEEESELTTPSLYLDPNRADKPNLTECFQLISQSEQIEAKRKTHSVQTLLSELTPPSHPLYLEGSSSDLRSGTETFPAPAAQAAALSLISQFFCSRLLPP